MVVAWEFPLEYHVATVCVIFATVLTFSIAEPLILPVGWFYFYLKRTVDKYVLLFGHDGPSLDRHFSQDHDTSALFYTVDSFLLCAALLLQLAMLHFLVKKQTTTLATALLVLSCALTVLELWRKARLGRQQTWGRQALPPTLDRPTAIALLGTGYYQHTTTASGGGGDEATTSATTAVVGYGKGPAAVGGKKGWRVRRRSALGGGGKARQGGYSAVASQQPGDTTSDEEERYYADDSDADQVAGEVGRLLSASI